jgi:HK97 family phage major capsid protein
MPALKAYSRGAEVDNDFTDGIIRLSFASEMPVLRNEDDGDFWEVLSHAASDCNFSFINKRGMVLQDHDDLNEIGDVLQNTVCIREDKKTCGQIKLFDDGWNSRAKTSWKDIPISVGYILGDIVSETRGADGIPVRKFKWRPFEVSLLTGDAADPTVGIGRSGKIDLSKITNAELADLIKQRNIKITMPDPVTFTKEQQDAAIKEARDLALINDRTRRTGIREIGEAFIRDYGSRNAEVKAAIEAEINVAMESDTNPAEWSSKMLREKAKDWAVKNIKLIADDDLHEDMENYSYARALQSAVRNAKNGAMGMPSGLEGEVAEELQLRAGSDFQAQGFMVPYGQGTYGKKKARCRGFKIDNGSAMARRLQRSGARAAGDLQAGVFGQGGGLIQTDLWMPMIALLRNLMVTERLGMQTISGLEGMVTWPRHVAACQPYFVPETFLLVVTNPLLDQLAASPHRVGVTGAVSKQLLLQNAIDAQNWMRDDQLKTHAVLVDQVSLLGTGANNQPIGIANTPGIGAVNFAGPVTYLNVINFKTQLALGNAAVADMAYVTTPMVEQKWRTTPKVGTTFPVFIWEDGSWGDETADGRVIGLRATATNQITLDRVLFGNFADAKKLFWGGLDVVVNPYSRSKEAVIEVTTNSWMDIMVDHQQSFAFSVDAGDQ